MIFDTLKMERKIFNFWNRGFSVSERGRHSNDAYHFLLQEKKRFILWFIGRCPHKVRVVEQKYFLALQIIPTLSYYKNIDFRTEAGYSYFWPVLLSLKIFVRIFLVSGISVTWNFRF